MSVSATNNSSSSSNAAEVTKSGHDAFSDIGIEDFLKLMTTELQNQDPLNPMDNAQMLEQINQIREIASNDNLINTMESVMLGQNMSTASGMIGRTIEALDNNGARFTGEVTKVGLADGVPTLYCTETIPEYDETTGELISEEKIEHETCLENVSYVVPAEEVKTTDQTLLSQQLSTASDMLNKTIVAAEGEEILKEDEKGNIVERGEAVSGLAGIVEKTLVEEGEVKVQILVPATESTDTDSESTDKRYVVSLSDVQQVVDSDALIEDLAVASSMVGREVVGSFVNDSNETSTIGGRVQQVYVNSGKVMLALQQDDGKGTLYGLGLDEVTNVYNYAEEYEITEDTSSTTNSDDGT